MAKNAGKIFEEGIRDSIKDNKDVYYYRIKDPAQSFNQSANTGLRFSPNNPYDCFMFKKPNFFPMELKATKGTSFSIQREKKDKGKMIKIHQIDGLTEANKVDGVYAGFLFNFYEKSKTYWLDIDGFNTFNNNTDKKSINEKDIVEHGAILVNQKLKRTKYGYHIKTLLEDIVEKYE